MKTLLLFLFPILLAAQNPTEKIVYLIPGQGADARLFQNIDIEEHNTQVIEFLIPEKGEDMAQYAQRMANSIDTTKRYSIVGVSLGGMVAVEINQFLQPEETIIIASAKCQDEIPKLYKFFRKFPLHRVLGGRFYKAGTLIVQPFYEPMDKTHRKIFKQMVKAKSPQFMKRAVRCIVEWEQPVCDSDVIHIHGTKDHTLPIKNVEPTVIVEGGSHVMTMLRGEEISAILNEYISE